MKIVSVGINHAGTSMIRTLLKINPKANIVAYDANTNISFLGCGIALWVGGEFDDPKGLFYSNKEQLEKMGAKIHMSHRVKKIDTKNKKIIVTNLETNENFEDSYDKLIYGGGTWPIVPPFPGVDLKNIYLSKLFQHAQTIKAKNNDPKVKNVVVVGAGYIGVELVEAFVKANKKVTLIDMESRVVARYFDKNFTDKMEDRMHKAGVTFALNEKVVEFKGKDGNVSAVVTNKNTYQADMVILSIGFLPQTKILQGQVEMTQTGAIKVDERMRTSNKDVYAIGDSVALKHAILGRANVALATNAVKSGIVAAMDVSGKGVDFPGIVGTNGINVFGCYYASTGVSEASAKKLGLEVASSIVRDKDRPEFMHNAEDVEIKITYNPKTFQIIGAQIGSWGKHNHSEAIFSLALAIQKQLTLYDVALMDFYFLPHYNKPFNFILTSALNPLGIRYN